MQKKIGEGDLTVRTELRKDDQTKQLAIAFSEMTNNLKEKIGEVKDKSSEISKTIGNIDDKLKGIAVSSEISEDIENLAELNAVLNTTLKYFKL
ncbi:MAG: hypothetical protein V1872_09645 [bacterium]